MSQIVELIRYDDGEFLLLVHGEQVGEVLTNVEARKIHRQLQDGTFDLQSFTAGVV